MSAGAEHGKFLLAWVRGLDEGELRDVLAYLSGYAPEALETALCEVIGPDHPAAAHD